MKSKKIENQKKCSKKMNKIRSNQNSDDSYDSRNGFSVHRRKTDLMPTIPSPRDRDLYRSSLGTHTPRTPGSY